MVDGPYFYRVHIFTYLFPFTPYLILPHYAILSLFVYFTQENTKIPQSNDDREQHFLDGFCYRYISHSHTHPFKFRLDLSVY